MGTYSGMTYYEAVDYFYIVRGLYLAIGDYEMAYKANKAYEYLT